MNANEIINDEMTLEQKLEAIDKAMQVAQQELGQQAMAMGLAPAPIDPQDLLMCEGCQ